MDYDAYFNFLYKIIKDNEIKEESSIAKFYKNVLIPDNHTKKEISKIPICIIEINLEDGYILLMEDLPINFFLSHTILIGEHTNLIQFKLKNKIGYYLAEKKIFDKLKEEIDLKTATNFSPKDLFKKNFSYKFEQTKIMKELKNYLSSIKKLNFNEIHLVSGNNIENFIPTIKQEHFRLAKRMQLPIISLIENDYIKDSSIHIYDYISQMNLLNPIFNYEKHVFWDFEKKTNRKLYKDLHYNLFFYPNNKEIEEKINEIKNTNIIKEEIIEEINCIKKIRINSQHGNIPLPLWKSHKNQKFIKIEDSKSFFELSGVEFKNNMEILKDIFLQTETGEKAIFKNQFLNPKLDNFLENLKINKEILYFKDYKELLFLLKINDKTEKLIKIEHINKNLSRELIKIIKFLIKKTTLLSINYNKIPYFQDSNDLLSIYFKSLSATLYLEYEKYISKPNKEKLVKNSIKKSIFLIQNLKQNEIKFEHLYLLVQNILVLLKILEKIDPKTSQTISEFFYSYYKQIKFKIYKTKIFPEIEKLFEDISIANKIAKNKKIIILEKQKFEYNYLNENIKIIENLNPNKYFIVPNLKKIKEIFPYSYEEIINKLKYFTLEEIKNEKYIQTSKGKIRLLDNLFKISQIYENKKKILENDYFILLEELLPPKIHLPNQ